MNSLQDQLLKAGLIDTKKAKQVQKEQRKQQKIQHKSNSVEVSSTQQAIQQQREEKLEKDRQLNAQRQAAAQQKAIEAQIKQMIQHSAQAKGDGTSAYQFVDAGKIKKMLVSDVIYQRLVNGLLAIAKQGDGYALIPSLIAQKIQQRDPSYIISHASTPTETPTEDDPYAAFTIPDDLMW